MKSTIMLALGLMVGCAAGVAVKDIVVPARAANQGGPVYEYKVVNLGWSSAEEAQNLLNRFGHEGWRVAAEAGAYVTFERSYAAAPRPSAAAPQQPY